MKKYFVEVGSTVTKIDSSEGGKIIREKDITILFKKHYNDLKEISKEDFDMLVSEIKKLSGDITIYGTSIFRKLTDKQKTDFLADFKAQTGIDFNIYSEDDEGILTVKGAIKNYKSLCCVFIGGGGSTEIAVCENGKINQIYNTDIGVIDVLNKFPTLADDISNVSLDDIISFIKDRLNMPKDINIDTLILAGGGHEKFARQSGIRYETNTLYDDYNAPIMMDIKTRVEDTNIYYTKTSLNKIKDKSTDPAWWDATRAMAAFVIAVANSINAKYVVPTDNAIVHGLTD